MRHCFPARAWIIPLILATLLSGTIVSVAHAAMTLALNGTSVCTIVEADTATEPERFAVQELTNFLHRVTGASFPVVTESSLSNGPPRIYVGWTEYAAGEGIDVGSLGEEEWIIRTVGTDLILTGGRPRGTLYAVYEFLEDHVGCHWLDHDTEVIPSHPTLEVGELTIQDKPRFWIRDVQSPTGTPDDKWKFMIRNKTYRYDFHGRTNFFPAGAFYRLDGSPHTVHSFSYFVNAADWFASNPEYFSLGPEGVRLPAYDDSGPGQLCLTHPDVLRLTVEKLREFIAGDRAEAAIRGCLPPRIYWINQNDQYDAHCRCPACQAVVDREGSQSGPLIEFVNAVAEDIEADYPDILVGTIAYNQTSTPPANARPRTNVLIGWCDVYSRCDGIRPLNDPLNVRNYAEMTGWGSVADRWGIGDDYWTALSYYSHFPTPYATIACVASDLQSFADSGAETFFAEAAEYTEAGGQFVPLKFWLAYHLLVDPYQPVEPLINIFTDGYYGAAAGKMREYLDYLQTRIDDEAQFQMLRNAPHKLAYLDLSFFVTSDGLFDQAEALVAPGSHTARHIRDERFILDGALLFLWPWLERALPVGDSMPFDHEAVIQRYEAEWNVFVNDRYSWIYSEDPRRLNKDGRLLDRMAALFRDPRLPEAFSGLPPGDVVDFNWLTFSPISPVQEFVADENAAGGMTAAPAMSAEEHHQPLRFGVTGGPTITLAPDEIPGDGAYHLHKIGLIRIEPGTTVWALEGRRLGVNVDRIFVPGAVPPTTNDWNVYISLKIQGPAYIEGSTETNGVWMDRVLLVRPQNGERFIRTYYVDGHVASSGDGLSWETAKKTIPEGYALTANNQENLILVRGDIQYTITPYLEITHNGISDTQRQVYRGVPGTNGMGRLPIISGANNYDATAFSATGTYDKVFWIPHAASLYKAWEGPLGGEWGDQWTLYTQMSNVIGVQTNPASWYSNGTTLYVHTSNGSHPSNFIIKTTSANNGFQAYASYMTFERFEFRHYREAAAKSMNKSSDYITFSSNRIHSTGGAGVEFRGGSHGKAVGNTMFDLPMSSAIYSSEDTAAPATYGGDLVAAGNRIHHCGSGMTLGADRCDVYDNIIYSNKGRAILFNPGDDHRVFNNLIYRNNSAAVRAINSTNVWIFNNTFYSNAGFEIYLNQVSTGARLCNNVVWAMGSGAYCLYVDAAATNGLLSDYNDLCTDGAAWVGRWPNANRTTLADWRTASHLDAHSISADPQFANIGSANFHLTIVSPCRDAGTASLGGVNAPDKDIDGDDRPLRGGYDIGCDEAFPSGTLFRFQ